MNWIFNQILNSILQGVGQLFAWISHISLDLFSVPIVQNALILCQWVGFLLLTVGVLFGIFNYVIASKDGETVDFTSLILNIIYGLIATVMLKPAAIFIFNISTVFQNLFNILVGTVNSVQLTRPESVSSFFVRLETGLDGLGAFWSLIVIVVIIISIIIVFFQCIKRSGIYLIQIMIGYLYIFSIPSGGSDGFIEWCRQTIAIAVTNAIQVGILYIGLCLLSNNMVNIKDLHVSGSINSLLGIGVILSATSVEKLAGRFGMAVNSRQHIGGAISQANASVSLGSSIGKVIGR